MKKLLTILFALAVILPTVTCLCVSMSVESTPVCAMDRPESCCCETEVKTPISPSVEHFVVPGGTSLPTLAVATAPVSADVILTSDSRQCDPTRLLLHTVVPQIYLQHQSFLI